MLFMYDTPYKIYLYFSKYGCFLKLGFTTEILKILYFVHTFVFLALVVHTLKLFRCTLNRNLQDKWPVYRVIHKPSGISDLCGTVDGMVTPKGSM